MLLKQHKRKKLSFVKLNIPSYPLDKSPSLLPLNVVTKNEMVILIKIRQL